MLFGLGFQKFIQSFVMTNIKKNVSADQKKEQKSNLTYARKCVEGLFSKYTLLLVISSKVASIP